jgi:type I restriction enzyme M protein
VPRYLAKDVLELGTDADVLAGVERLTLRELKEAGCLQIRKGHEVGSEAYGTGDIPFIRTSDLNNFEVSTDPTKSVSEEVFERYSKRQRLHAGDILMVVDGRYRIGTTAIVSERNRRAVVQSHIRMLTLTRKSNLSPYALLYSLNLPSVKAQIRNLVFVQSTLGTLGNRLLELRIPVFRGQGPWTDRVNRFQELLCEREASLSELQKMSGEDVEL